MQSNLVTVSPKYQVVIPEAVRRSMQIKPGDKLKVVECGTVLEMVPMRELKAMRGAFKGLPTHGYRDKEWR
jgi:AbrB family looped-hinge helix DNA binding protein